MSDAVYRKLEIVGSSPISFADAAARAVAAGAKDLPAASWFEVRELRGAIQDGKISQFQVTVAIGARTNG